MCIYYAPIANMNVWACYPTRAHKNGQLDRVRAFNYVKIETGRNFLPVVKIVTRTVQAGQAV